MCRPTTMQPTHLALAGALWLLVGATAAADSWRDLQLPPGFALEVVSQDLPNARQMALSETGTLFVGTRRAGNVYALPNALAAKPGAPVTIASGLTMPSGIALRDGDLYVGALNRILTFADIDDRLAPGADYEVVLDDLPDHPHHGWKYLRFGPDDALYIPVGAPCNICLSEDERFASLLRRDMATGTTTVYAHGIRNTVGFDWHPTTGALWFSDNGRDMLGDDIPAEEINVATAAGQHFGYPFIHAGDLPDPEFGEGANPADYVAPRVRIQAHSAALGVAFYTGSQFPERYHHALFIAEHGSWNRTSKVGYQVSVVTFDEQGEHYAPFITGWLQGERNWGRPNDVLIAPDGSLLISDDQAGAVYRVRATP